MIRTPVLSSPGCWVDFSGTGWKTDRSDLLPLPLRCPSCNRWRTARRRAEGVMMRLSTSRLRRPLPSRCPIRPPQQSSVPAPLSRWTSCHRHPSPSCSSQSSAFSWLWWLTWPPVRAVTVVSGLRKPMLLRINKDKMLVPLCRWPFSWMMEFLTSRCSSLLDLCESCQAPV